MGFVLRLKQGLALLALLATAVVTIATSDGRHYQSLSHKKTRYEVQSDCVDKINSAVITVDRDRIINSVHSENGEDKIKTIENFRAFGFYTTFFEVGDDTYGTGEFEGYSCLVKSRSEEENEEAKNPPTDYYYYKAGFLTTTNYECEDNRNYPVHDKVLVCSISFKELNPEDDAAQ